MLTIVVPASERFNELTSEFIVTKQQTLQLEHSLVSISKWESKWHKPFLGKEEKSSEEILDYIRCMTLTQNVDKDVYGALTQENLKQISEYIENPMTATWFSKNAERPSREIITSELIYYWMISQQIPFECQKWHINRLLTLIRICSIKNAPPKKMSKQSIISQNKALNEARRRQMGSSG